MTNIFSSREIAASIWIIIFCVYSLVNPNVRQSAYKVFQALRHKSIICSILSLFAYVSLITYFLYICRLWDINLLKDTCIWVLFTALNILLNVHKARDFTFFKQLMTGNIKIALAIEFLFNFHTFPLIIELIILPLITLLVLIQSYIMREQNQKYEDKITVSCIDQTLSLAGYIMFIYVLWMTVKDYQNLFSIASLKTFLLPILLTTLSIPYFYIIALIIEYDSVLMIIRHTWRNDNPNVAKDMIKATIRYANINLKSLSKVWRYHTLYNPAKETAFDCIKRIVTEPQYTIGHTAKLAVFNDIKTVINRLSKNGIGTFSNWGNMGGGVYSTITDYFLIGESFPITNNIVYYITGGKDYIERVELSLNINYQQDKDISIAKFKEFVSLTCSSLKIICPQNLIDAVDEFSGYYKEYDTYSLKLQQELLGEVETWTFSIITRL